jgi:hypothetical protein
LILVVFEGCVVNWKFFLVHLGGGEERLGGVERWDNGSLGWWIGMGITVMVVRAWMSPRCWSSWRGCHDAVFLGSHWDGNGLECHARRSHGPSITTRWWPSQDVTGE